MTPLAIYVSQANHAVIATMALYLFLVFAWWWAKQGKATTVYGVTCFLMFGVFINHAGAWWIYYQASIGVDPVKEYSLFMAIRQYLIMIPMAGYVYHITKRIIKNEHVLNGQSHLNRGK